MNCNIAPLRSNCKEKSGFVWAFVDSFYFEDISFVWFLLLDIITLDVSFAGDLGWKWKIVALGEHVLWAYLYSTYHGVLLRK